jgi:16S rRNA (guanine1207-N2)-methyltransferase
LCGEHIQVISKPGIPFWDQVTPSLNLMAEKIHPSSDSHILILGAGHGALGVVLARLIDHGQLILSDFTLTALRIADQTLKINLITNAKVIPFNNDLLNLSDSFDIIAMDLPKGRNLARYWLITALGLLHPDGQLYIAGANQNGIQSICKDAETLFGNLSILGYKKGYRIARCIKKEMDRAAAWRHEPGITPGTWYEFPIQIREHTIKIRSSAGIFSYNHLDPGTNHLIKQLTQPLEGRVLDFGCGYGIIGIVASFNNAEEVDLIDNNFLAIQATQENLRINKINSAKTFPSDLFSAVSDHRYNWILSNPPFHIGSPVDYEISKAMILQSWELLESKGKLIIVANRFIRYDDTMHKIFQHVEQLYEDRQYYVIAATK